MMYRLPPLGELANKLEVKSNLPSADDSASHAPPSSRRWNSETLRAAYMLIGKEMRRHPRESRQFGVCFAAYQQVEATDVNLGSAP